MFAICISQSSLILTLVQRSSIESQIFRKETTYDGLYEKMSVNQYICSYYASSGSKIYNLYLSRVKDKRFHWDDNSQLKILFYVEVRNNKFGKFRKWFDYWIGTYSVVVDTSSQESASSIKYSYSQIGEYKMILPQKEWWR